LPVAGIFRNGLVFAPSFDEFQKTFLNKPFITGAQPGSRETIAQKLKHRVVL